MKTTIDLPNELVHQLKIRAAQEGRKLKDLAADLLRSGLTGGASPNAPAAPVILKDPKTDLPVIQCRRAPARPLTPEHVAQILSDQETGWSHESA